MEYADSSEQTSIFAEKALEEMRVRGLTQHPNNYSLWYAFVSTAIPDLTLAITSHDEKKEPITEHHCSELYEKFFSTAREEAAVVDASSKLSNQVTTVLGDITAAGEDAGAHISDLGTVLENLSNNDEVAEAKTAISSVIEITRNISEKNSALEINLRRSSAEIERLRGDLEILRQEAYTDGLTGIANRKRFDQVLKQSTINAMEDGISLCLMMIDIDHFKAFNDAHGHQVGDLVLKLLAGTLRENVKGQDTPARYGGEEFAVILPNTQLADAISVAETLRKVISTKNLRDKKSGRDMGRITISVGVTIFQYGEAVGQFIYRADQALYHAKNTGRDKVCSDSDIDTTVAHHEI